MDTRREFFRKALASGTALWAGLGPLLAQETKTAAPMLKDLDVTAEWAKLHADPKFQPPTAYRPGTVVANNQKIRADKTANGFAIQLPGRSPVPTPAVSKGRLFVSGGFKGTQFFSFDAENGKSLWSVDLGDDGPSSPAVDEDAVVVNTESCTIFTLEASTGKMRWSWWLGDPLMSAPTIAHGRVFTAYPASVAKGGHKDASHLLGAFDLKTGKILWQRWVDSDVISAPVASGDEVVAATFSGTVFRFKQETGELLSAIRARATSAPVVMGKELHFSRRTGDPREVREALSVWEKDGKQVGRELQERDAKYLDAKIQKHSEMKATVASLDSGNGFSSGAPQTAKAEVALGNVGQANVASLQSFQGSRILPLGETLVACMGDELVCADSKGGVKLWSVKLKGDLQKAGGFLGAPPVAAGDSLFMSTLSGTILRIDPHTGKTKSAWDVGRPMRFPPSIDGGRIYAGTQDGLVVCIETGDAKNTGWPQWGGNAQRTGVASE